MEGPPLLETVSEAIQTLYKGPNAPGQEKASLWLGDLQKSIYAWKIADELLHQKRDLESCYFAAQTMRTKIQYSFHELPPDAHQSLRDSLLGHISQINEQTNSVIVTQLCLALADLVLQMPLWQKPISDLVSQLGQNHLWPLLEILTLLPEEVNSRSLRLGANRREEILQELRSNAKTVAEFLRACFLEKASQNMQIHVRLLRCFTSWISIQALPLSEVTQHVIFMNAFQILSDHQTPERLHEAGTECICCILECLQNNSHQEELEQQMFTGVRLLEEAYHMSVATEDMEKTINYCRVFTELGEALLERMVTDSVTPHYSVSTLEVVLICVGYHDYEVAEITFNLWYRLSEELYRKSDENLNLLFRPYIERLLGALCKHCQMEPDHEGVLDESDDFGDFRVKVSELVKDVVFIVGSSTVFRQMFLQLQSASATWDTSEAALFIMQAVAKNIIPQENEVVPKVVEAILNLPENTHMAVRHTSILLLGELCEWIERHPETLEPVLNFLLFCLQQPTLATAGANALQNICSACRDHMAAHLSGLLQLVQSLDKFNVSNSAAVGLLKGVAVIVGRLNSDEIGDAMKKMCWVQVSPLAQLLQGDMSTEKDTFRDPVLWLDRLAAIFRHISPTVHNGQVHPCLPVITEMWPVLSETCSKFQSDVRVMERCCRCLRFAVRCVGKQSAPLLEPLVKLLVSLYQCHQHSCFLYLGSILVDEYAAEPGCAQGLLEMLQAFLVPTFKMLEEPSGLQNHPDTVDDLFRLCTRFLQRSPVPFLQSVMLPGVLSCSLHACSLDHREANSSVMKFFFDMVHCGRNREEVEDFALRRPLVENILKDHGQVMVGNLVNAAVFCLPSYTLPDIGDVLMELMLFNRPNVCVWLEATLKALPTQSASGNVNATQKQLARFHREVTSAETTKVVSHALREFIRLYR